MSLSFVRAVCCLEGLGSESCLIRAVIRSVLCEIALGGGLNEFGDLQAGGLQVLDADELQEERAIAGGERGEGVVGGFVRQKFFEMLLGFVGAAELEGGLGGGKQLLGSRRIAWRAAFR